MADNLDLHAVGIGEGQHLFVEAFAGALDREIAIAKALLPEVEGSKGHAERGLRHLAHT